METAKTPWYQSTLGIIALLVIFFPVGLFLMWKHAKWNKFLKGFITLVFVVLVIGNFSKPSPKTPETPSPTPSTAANINKQTNYYFDIPSLIGKNVDQLSAILGTPKGDDPTSQQVKLGTKEWDKTYTKDGHELIVTYTISDKKIVDFFIATDDPSGKTMDTRKLMDLANVNQDDPRYTIEFVKCLKGDGYTGIKIIPN